MISRSTLVLAALLGLAALSVVASHDGTQVRDAAQKGHDVMNRQSSLRYWGYSTSDDSSSDDSSDDSEDEAAEREFSASDSELEASDESDLSEGGETESESDREASGTESESVLEASDESDMSEGGDTENEESDAGKEATGDSDLEDEDATETSASDVPSELEIDDGITGTMEQALTVVTMSVGLAMSGAQFDEAAQQEFKIVVGQVADANPDNVNIVDVVATRRRLLAGIAVKFEVGVAETMAESAIESLTEDNLGQALASSPLPAFNAVNEVSVLEPAARSTSAQKQTVQPTNESDNEGESDSDYDGSSSDDDDDVGKTVGITIGAIVGGISLLIGICFAVRSCSAPKSNDVANAKVLPTATPVAVSNEKMEYSGDQGLCYPTAAPLAMIQMSPTHGGATPMYQVEPPMLKVVEVA